MAQMRALYAEQARMVQEMQKTLNEMRISDWSSDVCSSDLLVAFGMGVTRAFFGSRFAVLSLHCSQSLDLFALSEL